MSLRAKVYLAMLVEFPIIGLILFGAAGAVRWAAGWVFMGLLTVYSVAVVLWLLDRCPGLVQERMTMFTPDQSAWDKVFVVFLMLVFIGWLVLMPLDAVRFGWSHVPLWVQGVGAVLLLISFYIFYLTYRENPYLSPMVRVQEERGQTVITTGPYRYVRHPLYAASLFLFPGTALLLGSWYGALATVVFVLMLAWRITGEERLLREKLPGYTEYTTRTKYRLIPGIW